MVVSIVHVFKIDSMPSHKHVAVKVKNFSLRIEIEEPDQI